MASAKDIWREIGNLAEKVSYQGVSGSYYALVLNGHVAMEISRNTKKEYKKFIIINSKIIIILYKLKILVYIDALFHKYPWYSFLIG